MRRIEHRTRGAVYGSAVWRTELGAHMAHTRRIRFGSWERGARGTTLCTVYKASHRARRGVQSGGS